MSRAISTALIQELVPRINNFIVPRLGHLAPSLGIQTLPEQEVHRILEQNYPTNYHTWYELAMILYLIPAMGPTLVFMVFLIISFPVLQKEIMAKQSILFIGNDIGGLILGIFSILPIGFIIGGIATSFFTLLPFKKFKDYILKQCFAYNWKMSFTQMAKMEVLLGIIALLIALLLAGVLITDYKAFYPDRIVVSQWYWPFPQTYSLEDVSKVKVTLDTKYDQEHKRVNYWINITPVLKDGQEYKFGTFYANHTPDIEKIRSVVRIFQQENISIERTPFTDEAREAIREMSPQAQEVVYLLFNGN